MLLVGGAQVVLHHLPHQPHQVDLAHVEAGGADLQLRQAEDVFDQRGQAPRLADDHVVAFLARLLVVEAGLRERLGVGVNVGQRRAQLVRHVVQEVVTRPLAFAQLPDVLDADKHFAGRRVLRKRQHAKTQRGFVFALTLRMVDRQAGAGARLRTGHSLHHRGIPNRRTQGLSHDRLTARSQQGQGGTVGVGNHLL